MKKILILLFNLFFSALLFSENLSGIIVAIVDNNLSTERRGNIYSIYLDENDKINYIDSSNQEYRFPERISELRISENVLKKMMKKYVDSDSESEMMVSTGNQKIILKPLHTYKDRDAVVFLFYTSSLKKDNNDMTVEVSQIDYLDDGKIEIR